MKTLEELKDGIYQQKQILAQKYKIKEIGIFGSYVRGEQKPQSDVDILVDFDESPSLLELVFLEDELSQALDAKVDLVMKSGLKPRLGQRILRKVVYL